MDTDQLPSRDTTTKPADRRRTSRGLPVTRSSTLSAAISSSVNWFQRFAETCQRAHASARRVIEEPVHHGHPATEIRLEQRPERAEVPGRKRNPKTREGVTADALIEEPGTVSTVVDVVRRHEIREQPVAVGRDRSPCQRLLHGRCKIVRRVLGDTT